MTTPLKPGDPVLVEARVDDTGAISVSNSDLVPERIHPLPAPVWVARENRPKEAQATFPNLIRVFLEQPEYVEELGRWRGERMGQAMTTAQWVSVYGADKLPEPGEKRLVHLLAIPTKEGE